MADSDNRFTFESIRKSNATGNVYWSARDLYPLLGYEEWRYFEGVVEKAKVAATNSGEIVDNHFGASTKMVQIGADTMREVRDYRLSRYACYLVAQNANPRYPQVAGAQTYFAVQTRRQELHEIAEVDKQRLEARQKLTHSDKQLSGMILSRDVDGKQLAQIKSEGDKHLFGGNDTRAMKRRYRIEKPAKPLADYLPTISLTAKQLSNEMTTINTTTKDLRGFYKIGSEHVHNNIEVRKSLTERGIKLEELPPEEDIKKVERRLKADDKKRLDSGGKGAGFSDAIDVSSDQTD